MRLIAPLATLALLATPVIAQKRAPTPEQRIERLEKQVRQVQKQVFPKGQPADTAGFSDDPAATQASVSELGSRLDSIERQMAELTRLSEENGNRVATLEADLARLRADQDRRLRAIESPEPAAEGPAAPATAEPEPTPLVSQPKIENRPGTAATPAAADAGEQAYDQGFRLWEAKKYPQAITALRAMASSFKGHRRVSWANNLVGRALLDSGQPRAAAEALLANYRSNPKGERAADSLYYLGQALERLDQPTQACKAYAELEAVYGTTMRAALRPMVAAARAKAQCS